MPRIIIIGNSGSCKTYLAEQLGTRLPVNTNHLDTLYWEPGGFSKKRQKEVLTSEIKALKADIAEKDGIIAEAKLKISNPVIPVAEFKADAILETESSNELLHRKQNEMEAIRKEKFNQ